MGGGGGVTRDTRVYHVMRAHSVPSQHLRQYRGDRNIAIQDQNVDIDDRYMNISDRNVDIDDRYMNMNIGDRNIDIDNRNIDIDDRYMNISDRDVDIMYGNIDAIVQT